MVEMSDEITDIWRLSGVFLTAERQLKELFETSKLKI